MAFQDRMASKAMKWHPGFCHLLVLSLDVLLTAEK